MKIIQGVKWYTPREIATQGLIENRKGRDGTISGHYHFVLEQIKAGRLQATSYSTGLARSYWLVSETSISKFLSESYL